MLAEAEGVGGGADEGEGRVPVEEVEELQARVVALSSELAGVYDLRKRDLRDFQMVVQDAEERHGATAKRLSAERDAHDRTRAANKALGAEHAKTRDEFRRMQNLYRKERVARTLSWAKVGQQNSTLQHLRRDEMRLNRKYQAEKKRRERSDAERNSMAAQLKPLAQSNLELNYRVSLFSERGDDAGARIALLGRELQAERHFAERLTKQAFDTAQERAIALEDAARRQLQVEELHEETRELTETLHDTEDRNDDLTRRLEASEAQRESLASELARTSEELAQEREAHAITRARADEAERELANLREQHAALEESYANLREEHGALQKLCESQHKELATFRKHTPLLSSVLTKSTYARLEHTKQKRETEVRDMLSTVRDLPIPSRWVPVPPEPKGAFPKPPRDARPAGGGRTTVVSPVFPSGSQTAR